MRQKDLPIESAFKQFTNIKFRLTPYLSEGSYSSEFKLKHPRGGARGSKSTKNWNEPQQTNQEKEKRISPI